MENNSSFLRKIVVVLLILLFFVLQCSVFNSLAMGGIIPNLMIILTSSFGFMRGEKEGLLIGFSCGLLCDIFFGSFLGFYAMVMMYIGFVNGKFSRIFYPEDIKLPLARMVRSGSRRKNWENFPADSIMSLSAHWENEFPESTVEMVRSQK